MDHLDRPDPPPAPADLQAMRAEIDELIARRAAETGRRVISAVGEGAGVVQVWLRADQEEFAAQLAKRYGPAVDLQVGAFAFPDRRRRHPATPPGSLEAADIEGLELGLELDRSIVEVGADGHGQLLLHNVGGRRIGPLSGGQPLAGVLLDDGGERVGGYVGWIPGTGCGVDLAPGETAAVDVLFGTASLREDLGYVLPPGEYRLRVDFPFAYGLVGPPTHVLTAPLLRVTVTARAPGP